MTIQDKIRAAAATYGVPAELALAVARQESGYRQYDDSGAVLRSRAGALGIMQLMPATAAWLGVDPSDPDANINGGVRYLSILYRQFKDWDLATAAYNAGPGNLQKILAGAMEIPGETADYVVKVLGKSWDAIKSAANSPPLDRAAGPVVAHASEPTE